MIDASFGATVQRAGTTRLLLEATSPMVHEEMLEMANLLWRQTGWWRCGDVEIACFGANFLGGALCPMYSHDVVLKP